MAGTVTPEVKESWADATDSEEEVCNSKSEREETGNGSLSSNIPASEGKEEAKSGGGDGSTEVVKSQIEGEISKPPLSPTGEGWEGNGGEGGRSGDNGGTLEVGKRERERNIKSSNNSG